MRKWLLNIRKGENMTQQDIADRSGVTRQMISAIENGEAMPSVDTAKTIAEVLGFDWTRFFEI